MGIAKRARTRRWIAGLVTLPIFIFILFPFYVMISTALKTLKEVYTYPPLFWPSLPQWDNFIKVWQEIPLGNFMLSSVVIAGCSTLLTILCAVPAAYALSRLKFPGRTFFLQIVLVGQLFSPVIVIVPLFKLIVLMGLNDSYLGLILGNTAFDITFSVWLLTTYFYSIPKDIEEAAFVDGASRVGAMIRIVLPLALPGVITVVIFAFITTWNEFMMALTFITSPEKKMITVGLFQLVGKFEVQWNLLTAGAIFGVLPTLILFMLIQKQLVRGLVSGAVK
jgi:multiple sugar transport system permease protein